MKLLSVKDIFEDNRLVIIEAIFEEAKSKIINIDIGVKDGAGDIIMIVTVDSKSTDKSIPLEE